VTAPANWWESFFSGLAVDFWRAAVPQEATAEDVAFLWKHLALRPGSRVLDVPCGAGRLTLPLAERGCAATGVDISEEFLVPGRAEAERRGLEVALLRAEMRDLPWTGEFDAAFCFGNSFGFLDDAGDAAFLAAVACALAPGGRFALDYGQSAESVFPRLAEHQEGEVAGFHFAEDTRYDLLTGRIENRFVFTLGERSETKLASQRVYTVRQVVRMLAEAGLTIRGLFGSPREEPFSLGSHRLLIVAEKARAASAAPLRATRD